MFWRLCKQCDPACKNDLHSTTVSGWDMESAGLSEEERGRLWEEETPKGVFSFTVTGFGVVVTG